MYKILDVVKAHFGADEYRAIFKGAPGRRLTMLKELQNRMLNGVSDFAIEVRSGDDPYRPRSSWMRSGVGKVVTDATMSKEAARWWWDQTGAVQNTVARQILQAEASDLGIFLPRGAFI